MSEAGYAAENDTRSAAEFGVDEEESHIVGFGIAGTQALQRRGTVDDVLAAMNDLKLIRTFIKNELVEGTDYGVIPGTGDKKNLLLPGAQKVCMFFNTRPEYDVERSELGAGHVEYIIKTKLISRTSGLPVGAGVGSCCTMEGKFRYRNAKPTDTGVAVPKDYWKDRDVSLIGGKDYTPLKVDGAWHIARKSEEKSENENIYDVRNTVLKMGKKRSVVDAAIALGCLSELFTQDLEDIFDLGAAGAAHSTEGKVAPTSQPQTVVRDSPVAQSEPTASPAAPITGNKKCTITLADVVMKDGKPRAWKYEGVKFAMYTDTTGKTWKMQGEHAIEIADKTRKTEDRPGTPILVEFKEDKFGRTVVSAEVAE